MATSGEYTITTTASDIIEGALQEIKVLEAGEIISNDDLAVGIRAMNYLLFQWQYDNIKSSPGLKLWTRERADLTLSSQISYELMPSGGDMDIQVPTEILTATLKNTDDDETLMTEMTLAEYENIPNKTDTGSPAKYYYEKRLDKGVLYLDIVPSDTTDVLSIVYRQPLEVITDQTDEIDIETYLLRALEFNLAVDLWSKFRKGEVTKTLASLAQQSLAKAELFYPADVNIYFEPGRDE